VFVNSRLARLRWRNATAVVGSWERQSRIQSGGQPGQPPLRVKIQMLERLAQAVTSAERITAAYGRARRAQVAEGWDAAAAPAPKAPRPRVAVASTGGGVFNGSSVSIAQMMQLSPEAQARWSLRARRVQTHGRRSRQRLASLLCPLRGPGTALNPPKP